MFLFQKLRVLASYDFPIMEDMAQDLSNALEESTKAPKSKGIMLKIIQLLLDLRAKTCL